MISQRLRAIFSWGSSSVTDSIVGLILWQDKLTSSSIQWLKVVSVGLFERVTARRTITGKWLGKDGTVYSYGGHGGHVSDATSLTDTKGNRIKWALDLLPMFTETLPLSITWSLAITFIQNVIHGQDSGRRKDCIALSFDIDSTATDRKDVTSSGRLGINAKG